jgi:tripartite-type tricarboxylate transporter receptor subunit TctC
MHRRAVVAALALPALPLSTPGLAQSDWSPTQPVRLIVPFAPGGSQDVLGRLLAQEAQGALGQPVLVENRSGAGGVLGAEYVARAAPDGHVLLLATAGQLSIAKALGRRLGYDPIGDFTPVIHLVDSPVVLLAAPELQAADAAALLRVARETHVPLAYASTGVGTNTQLIMEDLKARAGLKLEHVPYRGAAAAFNDLAAGRVQLMFVSVPSALAAGGPRPRIMAVASRARFPGLPEVPTLIEAGVPGFEAEIWTGIVAPAATPPGIVARLADAFHGALGAPSLQPRLAALGAVPKGEDAPAFAALLQADLARWSALATALDLKAE